jgi:antitoxin (DNA-binding transcriptional repressor) of toxin-antitoxin stability system
MMATVVFVTNFHLTGKRGGGETGTVIARAGRPVARLTRLAGTGGKRRLGVLDGRFRIPDDFNRPLPDEVLRAFEGE